jgi:hypothetical protein
MFSGIVFLLARLTAGAATGERSGSFSATTSQNQTTSLHGRVALIRTCIKPSVRCDCLHVWTKSSHICCLGYPYSPPSGLPSMTATASSCGLSTACVPTCMRRSYAEAEPRLRLLYMMPPSIPFSIKDKVKLISRPAHLASPGARSSHAR